MKVKCITNKFNWAGFYCGKEYEIVDLQCDYKSVDSYYFCLIGDRDNEKRCFYKNNLIEDFGMTEESVMNLINKLMIFK